MTRTATSRVMRIFRSERRGGVLRFWRISRISRWISGVLTVALLALNVVVLDCWLGARVSLIESAPQVRANRKRSGSHRPRPSCLGKHTCAAPSRPARPPTISVPARTALPDIDDHSAALAGLAPKMRVGAGKPHDVPSVTLTRSSHGSRKVPATMSCMKV
jgi:hypothetical protein